MMQNGMAECKLCGSKTTNSQAVQHVSRAYDRQKVEPTLHSSLKILLVVGDCFFIGIQVRKKERKRNREKEKIPSCFSLHLSFASSYSMAVNREPWGLPLVWCRSGSPKWGNWKCGWTKRKIKSTLESSGTFESVLNPLFLLRSKKSIVCNVSGGLWVSCVKLALDASEVSQEWSQRSEVRSVSVLAEFGVRKGGVSAIWEIWAELEPMYQECMDGGGRAFRSWVF